MNSYMQVGICCIVFDFSGQFSALEALIERNNYTITETLLQLTSNLHTSSASISSLMNGAKSLEAVIQQLSVATEETRGNMAQRLDTVEGAALSEEDIARVFAEEMDKSTKNSESILWVWLFTVG